MPVDYPPEEQGYQPDSRKNVRLASSKSWWRSKSRLASDGFEEANYCVG